MSGKFSVTVLVNRTGVLKFDYSFTANTVAEAVEAANVWKGSGKIFSIENSDGTVVEVVKC